MWYFHNSPCQLDDPKAPLPLSSKSSAGDKSPKPENADEESATLDGTVNPAYYSSTSFAGSIVPSGTWSAFSPYDNANLVEAFNSKEQKDIVVGFNRLYKVSSNILEPIYWAYGPAGRSSVHGAKWVFSSGLGPCEPELEDQIEEAYQTIRPWTEEYLEELKSGTELAEDLIKRIATPAEYTQLTKSGPVKMNVYLVFAPIYHERTVVTENQDEPDVPEDSDKEAKGEAVGDTKSSTKSSASKRRSRSSTPILTETTRSTQQTVYVFSKSLFRSSILSYLPPLTAGTYSSIVAALINGNTPSSLLTSLRCADHFEWSEYKKVNSLPDRPTDDADYKPKAVNQLVLVLHGIGQKLSERVESFNFSHAINSFRILVNQERDSEIVSGLVREDTHIMALPINWRRNLNFDQLQKDNEDVVVENGNSSTAPYRFTLKNITPPSIPAVRSMVADIFLDIPYYMSNHKPYLLSAAASESNRVYDLFCRYNPDFKKHGKVHLIGHSLGSVIAMDLLSNQPTDVNKPSSSLRRSYEVNVDALHFNTHNLFLVGSPGPVFLLLKNAKPIPRKLFDQETGKKWRKKPPPYGCLAVQNIYNVVHYSDPVAYRFNPTVDVDLADRLEVAHLPSEADFLPKTSFMKSIRIPFFSASGEEATGEKEHNGESHEPSAIVDTLPKEVELPEHDFERESTAEYKMELFNDNGQIDFIIPLTGTLENQYVAMLTAHFGYWDNKDFARLVAIECGREEGPDYTIAQYKAVKKSSLT